jgi:hypothetical protein
MIITLGTLLEYISGSGALQIVLPGHGVEASSLILW